MPLSNPSLATVSFSTSNTSVRSNIPASTTSALLLASNPARKGATIWNNSTSNLYIEFVATATTTVFAVKISADGYYELPFNYTGSVSGIWDAATGLALVRELT